MNKQETTITAEQLIAEIENYRKELFENPKVSATKFNNMQSALYGAKCIIRHLYKLPQKSETAWVK